MPTMEKAIRPKAARLMTFLIERPQNEQPEPTPNSGDWVETPMGSCNPPIEFAFTSGDVVYMIPDPTAPHALGGRHETGDKDASRMNFFGAN